MNNDANFMKDPADHVLAVIHDALGDTYHYVNGLMDNEIPVSLIPLVMASITDGDITAGASGQDDIAEELTIIIAINKKDYVGGKDDIDESDLALRRIVMGVDPNTREYLPNTVMYAIRKNFTLEGGVVENRIRFDFQAQQRGENLYTQEVMLTLNVGRMVQVPSRN